MKLSSICYIATDYNTKAPILNQAMTQTGKPIYKGKLSWVDGKTQDGKKKYSNIKFHTFNQSVFDTFKSDTKAAFDVEGYLKIDTKKDMSGNWNTFIEAQITSARVHNWDQQKPVQHFQEKVEAEETDESIPF